MGANAQTTVQKFVDGAVLTAAQQNTSAATGVPVFATTVTRDAAFGGANKVLAEGQTCYLESTNVVQYYDGAAWATVGPAAASGLVFIASLALAGGGTTTSGVVFTSTYENYLITSNNIVMSAANNTLDVQMDVSGTPTTTGYYGAGFYSGSPNTATSSTGAVGFNNVAQIPVCLWNATRAGFQTVLSAPQLAAQTQFYSSSTTGSVSAAARSYNNIGATLNGTTQYNQIKFLPSAGTITSGTIKIYGYSLT